MAGDWSDQQNDAIVADYFAMLADDIAGRPYSKAEHNRLLQAVIDRPRGSIEYKHQNISAVLKGLGEDWIPGYKPAFNFQASLVDAVVRWLDRHPDWLAPAARMAMGPSPSALREEAMLWIGPPPTHSNAPPPEELEQVTAIARKYDVAARDARNRALGRAGEERVLAHERASLLADGRHRRVDRLLQRAAAPPGARLSHPDGGVAFRPDRRGCGHDGQRERVAHMPTDAKAADRSIGSIISEDRSGRISN